MKPRNNKEMKKATSLGVTFCLVIYLMTGVLGFIMYRDQLTDTILDNFKNDIRIYLDSDTFLTVVLVIVNISFLISSTMSIPLMFFSLKKNFFNTVIFFKKNFGKKKEEEKEIANDHLIEKLGNQTTYISHKEKLIITLALYLLICVISIVVRDIGDIFDIVGSTAANAINYILPTIFFIKLTKTRFFSGDNILPQIIFIVGVIVLILSLVSEILKLIIKE